MNFPSWDELLLSTPKYSFFFSSSWARVLHETYDYYPLYFTLIDHGTITISIPLMEIKSFLSGYRGVSLPFSDYCDPILPNHVDFQDAFEFLVEYGKQIGWRYIEIRGGREIANDLSPSSHCYGHRLDLSHGEEQLFSGFKSSTKRNIKKAIREGVKVEVNNSLESIIEFYRLNCITRKNHGLPPQPLSFFKKIFKHVISNDQGFVVLGSYKGKVISSAIIFHFGNKAIYKYGASDKSYQHLRSNNLVMWEALKHCSREGNISFCFGRTESENKGLRRFKSSWGADERIINYYRYDVKKKRFITKNQNITGFHNMIFRVMPIQLSRLVGKVLYRHVG